MTAMLDFFFFLFLSVCMESSASLVECAFLEQKPYATIEETPESQIFYF